MARIVTPAFSIGWNEVAANSLVVTSESPIAIKSGVADLAVNGDKLEGVSVETKTFDADNETVKKAKLEFFRLGDDTLVEFPVVNGTLAQSDVNATFDLDSNGNVDYTALTPSQLTLRKIVNGTLGQFVRAK